MTTAEKIAYIKYLMPDISLSDDVIGAQLTAAESAIMAQRFPFGIPDTVIAMPTQFENIQCLLAVRYITRMGADGEIGHNENGINRSYASPDDVDLLRKILPLMGVRT